MTRKPIVSWVLAAIVTGLPAVSLAADESPSLLQIMRQLGHELNQLSDGLWRDDYAAIATAAQAIADHPQPPVAERTRIITGLGADAGRFRQGDQAVHDAALAVKEAAERQDAEQLLPHYLDLVTGCRRCHTAFRARVRALAPTD